MKSLTLSTVVNWSFNTEIFPCSLKLARILPKWTTDQFLFYQILAD